MRFPVIIALIILFLIPIGCSREAPPPVGWSGHSFKLFENPGSFEGAEAAFKYASGYETISNDTRKVFRLGEIAQVGFNVNLPKNGQIKFSYGITDRLVKFGPSVNFIVKEVLGEESKELLNVTIDASDAKLQKEWTDVVVPISSEISGDAKLYFTLSGLPAGTNAREFYVANPTIVSPYTSGKRTRVIWIAIDTLRPDHLGCYGYDRPVSPNIDKFAAESTVFDKCISTSGWTFPAFAAMLTGKYPSLTGATTNSLYLPSDVKRLPELVSEAGIATASFHNISWVGTMTGLHRGFDSAKLFLDQYDSVAVGEATKWLEDNKAQDCMLFLHLYNPHIPYEPEDKFYGTFDPGYTKEAYKRSVKGLEHITAGQAVLTPEEKFHVIALYDEEIMGTDDSIGTFIAALKSDGLYDDSLIIINSDHGDEFGEHGKYQHGRQMYDETVRVPMMIKGRGFKKGKRISGLCSNIDIVPEILRWFSLEIPGDLNTPGLQDLLSAPDKPTGRKIITEQIYFDSEQKRVTDDQYCYILHTVDGIGELYDMLADPDQKVDLSGERKSTAREMSYFASEFALKSGTGWHVYICENGGAKGAPVHYTGKITAPSGIADIKRIKLNDTDKLEIAGNEILVDITIAPWASKAFDFSTNTEDEMVTITLSSPDNPQPGAFFYLGPGKTQTPGELLMLSLNDLRLGLGVPEFGPAQRDAGFFIWGISQTRVEKDHADIDPQTREQLKSVGYFN